MSTRIHTQRIAVAFGALAAATVIGGCSASVHTTHHSSRSVSGSTVAKVGAAQFSKQYRAKFTMSCPHSVTAKVGATTRCVTTNPAGTRFGTTVTVSSVTAGHVEFDFKNDDHPMT